jgi:hypothetical protein
MLDFSEEIVEFKIGADSFSVKKPTNGQIKEYTKDLGKCESETEKEVALLSLLSKLGLSEEVFNKLTPSQAKKLLSALYDSEKN